MRRGCVAFLALALIAVALVGCGRFGVEQREPWRVQAEEACLASKLVTPSAYMSRVAEIDGPGACGITYPFKVTALAGGTVGVTNRLTLGCPIIPEINAWLDGTVQAAAEMYLGTSVTDIRAGSYSCRSRNNQRGAKLSEHGFGNAIDVMGFKLADGRELTVLKGWRGAPEEQDFLREVFLGACRHFTTVLAPGSDMFHYDHFHLDLARHDPRGRRRVCKPVIKFESRLDPDRPVAAAPARPRPSIRSTPEPAEPLEIEDDEDPYEAASARPVARVAATPPAPRPAPRPAASPVYAASAPRTEPTYRADPARYAGGSAGPSSPRADAPPRAFGPPETRSSASQRPPAGPAPGAPLVLQPHLLSGAGIY
jgi:hypothetical protein